MAGFTPTSTMAADVAASTFPWGSSSSATLLTPVRPASSAALADVRLVAVTPAPARPDRTRPCRIAPPMEPAPRIAIGGSDGLSAGVIPTSYGRGVAGRTGANWRPLTLDLYKLRRND